MLTRSYTVVLARVGAAVAFTVYDDTGDLIVTAAEGSAPDEDTAIRNAGTSISDALRDARKAQQT